MRQAFVNNVRVKPFKGGRGECSICFGPVYARTEYQDGTSPHWVHMPNYEFCDTWHENETEWHISWKNLFPEEWQEQRMKDNQTGEFHQADVKTDNGVVIEFQNSPISLEEIRSREAFYGKIIWIINAIPFKQNFKLYSEVNSKLRNIELSFSRSLGDFIKQLDEENKIIINNIDKLKKEIESLSSHNLQNKFELYSSILTEILEYKQIVFENITKGTSLNHWELREFIDSIDETKSKIKTIIESIGKSESENKRFLNIIETFENLPSVERGTKILKIIDPTFIYFNDVLKTKWDKIIVKYRLNTKKESYTEQPIKGEFQVASILLNSKQYGFLLDDEEIITKLKNKIETNKDKIIKLDQDLSLYKTSLEEDFTKWIETKIIFINSELEIKKELTTQKISELLIEENQFENKKYKDEKGIDEYKLELEKDTKKEKYRVMKTYKRLYSFNLHSRKVWYQAKGEVFFDTGEDLFYRIKPGIVKKYSKEIFLRKYSVQYCSIEDKMHRIYSNIWEKA